MSKVSVDLRCLDIKKCFRNHFLLQDNSKLGISHHTYSQAVILIDTELPGDPVDRQAERFGFYVQ